MIKSIIFDFDGVILNSNNIKAEAFGELYNKYGTLKAKAFPGRAAILIKLLSLDEKIISSVYEKTNSMKVGNYIPGTRIPIKPDKILFKNIKKEKIILNLAWHISSEIKKYLKNKGFKGKIIDILEKKDFKQNHK